MKHNQPKTEMTMDYRSMYDKDYIGDYDLNGKDVTLTISDVRKGTVKNMSSKEQSKPVLSFQGRQKKMICNATNGKTIAALYGNDTRAWVGKQITIYPTTANFGGQTVGAIRVRPMKPKGESTPELISDEPTGPDAAADAMAS